MRSILAIVGASATLALAAQGPLTLSLQQAMDLAAQQSYAVQGSELEAEKARARIKEVMAMGLPQIDASGSLNNFIDVPTQVFPSFFGGGNGGDELIAAQFGLPWNATYGLQLNQLLFDGGYIVGLQATRELRTQADQDLERARADARAQAAKSYLGVLAAREGARLAAESVPVLEKSANEADAMFRSGFMEQTDVDRLNIALASARDRARSFAQQERVAMAFLRLVLGVAAETPIELTDRLETIVEDPAEVALSSATLDLSGHVEHRLAATYVRIQELDVRNQRSAYLPELYWFFSHQQQSYTYDFDLGGPWYPATLWGLTLNVPIFSSGMRANRVKQARLSVEQAGINLAATEQRLKAEAEERAQKAITSEETYRTQRDNLALSRRIFDRTSIKFTSGLSSSFELNQDQTQLLAAQQDYITALADLLLARVELRRTLDLY